MHGAGICPCCEGPPEEIREIFQAAIDAIDACTAADEEEARRFQGHVDGTVHVNAVRAAERKSNAAHYAAIDAVSKAAEVDERIAENWGFSTQEPGVRAAIVEAMSRPGKV